jgi:hypothetical protein
LASTEDLSVIHATLQLCNAAVHHQPKLAMPFLSDPILPALLNVVTLKVWSSWVGARWIVGITRVGSEWKSSQI